MVRSEREGGNTEREGIFTSAYISTMYIGLMCVFNLCVFNYCTNFDSCLDCSISAGKGLDR